MNNTCYPSDLSDAQWAKLEPLLPASKPGGRPRTVNLRKIINGILYLTRSGCQWRMLPKEYPPWSTVYWYFREWRLDGTWERIHHQLREEVRVQAGHTPQPTAAIIDSQSVKTTEMGGTQRGHDAGKKINGRKRHIVVDTLGLLLLVVVHSAGLQDRDGAMAVLTILQHRFPSIRVVWADSGYAGALVSWVAQYFLFVLEIIRRPAAAKGFVLLPRRWVVERTFGWLGRSRRLSKDYERLPASGEAFVYITMTHLMLRRLKPK